jgi:hypothetical protein
MNAALNLDALYPVTKCCTKCHRDLPVDAFKWKRRPGRNPYRDSHCRECKAAYMRARYVPQVVERHPMERLLDAAFRDWRDIGARGANLGWRV